MHHPVVLLCLILAVVSGQQSAVLQVDQVFDQAPVDHLYVPTATWLNEDGILVQDSTSAVMSEPPTVSFRVRAIFPDIPLTERDLISVDCTIVRAASPGNAVDGCFWEIPSRGMGVDCSVTPLDPTLLRQSWGFVTTLDINGNGYCIYGGTKANSGAFLVDYMSREVSVSLTTNSFQSFPDSGSTLNAGDVVVVDGNYWDTSGRLAYECTFSTIGVDPQLTAQAGTVANETSLICPVPASIETGDYELTVREVNTGSVMDPGDFPMSFSVVQTIDPSNDNEDGDDDDDDNDGSPANNPLLLGGIGAAAAVVVFGGALFARSRSSSSSAFLASEKSLKSKKGSSASNSSSGLISPAAASAGGKKRRTIGLAIDDLMSKMSVTELTNYAVALVDGGHLDEALALLVKLEQRSANGGTVAEYLRVIEVMSVLFVRKGGRQDELKAVKEAQRQSVNVKGHKMKGGLMKGKAYQRLQEEAEVVSKKPASRKNPRPRAASGGRKGSNAAGSSGGGKKKVRSGSAAVSNAEMWELSSVRSVAKEFTTVPISSMMSDGSRSYKSVTSSQAPHFRSEGSRSVGRS